MQIHETDIPEEGILNLKTHTEGDNLRLTFQWPPGIEQIYVFKTKATSVDVFDICTADQRQARLYTLQEYKKHAGYVEAMQPGVYSYHIFPFRRANGEDTAIVYTGHDVRTQNTIDVTGQIAVQFSIQEKKRLLSPYKIHMVELSAQHEIEDDVLCYVKKEKEYPEDVQDGSVYFFGGGLKPGISFCCEVKTLKNEYIRIFVRNPDKAGEYLLVNKNR